MEKRTLKRLKCLSGFSVRHEISQSRPTQEQLSAGLGDERLKQV